jgi:hypothetical protein
MRWYTLIWAMSSSSHLLVNDRSLFPFGSTQNQWDSSLDDRWDKMLHVNKSLTCFIYYPDGYFFFSCKEKWRLHPQYTAHGGTYNTRHFVETDARSSGHRLRQAIKLSSSPNRKRYASITEMSQSVMYEVHDTQHCVVTASFLLSCVDSLNLIANQSIQFEVHTSQERKALRWIPRQQRNGTQAQSCPKWESNCNPTTENRFGSFIKMRSLTRKNSTCT